MGSYKEHQNLIKRFKLLAVKKIPHARFFDRHVGTFYTRTHHPIKINRKGMSDLYGIITTPSGLIHVEIEAKTGEARQTYEQRRWQEFIESMGGGYFLLRDENETIQQLIEFVSK